MGGKDNSPEGLQVCLETQPTSYVALRANGDDQRGYSHSFVLEFSSTDDRDYYIKHDPAHMAFGAYLTGIVEDKVMVMDFVPGVF